MRKPLPNWKNSNINELEIFSKIKLIVVDLDGTLIHHGDSEPYENIIRLCKNLRHYRYQVSLTIATGRTLKGAESLINNLLLPIKTPVILYNGGLIVSNGTFKIIHKATFRQSVLSKIIKIASDYKTYVLAYFIQGPSTTIENKSYEYILGWSTAEKPLTDFNNIKIQWQKSYRNKEGFLPSAILVDTADDAKREKEIESRLAQISDLSMTKSGTAHYIEIRPKGINKGRALQIVAKFLQISSEKILALGDNDNDIEMLDWAGIGVAIRSATVGAIKKSDFLCSHDAATGAVEVLRLIKQARYYFFHPQKHKNLSSEYSK